MNDLISLCGFAKSPQTWRLIYRGSTDGFGAANFHSKCDDVRNTLVMIKTSKNHIFGGFASKAWKQNGEYIHDKDAFIFSLTNIESCSFKILASGVHSIYGKLANGPTFGAGHNLFIASDSNKNEESYSNLGHTYLSSNYQAGSTKALTILGGSYYFQTIEIEVFELPS